MKGNQIKTLKELAKARQARQAVVSPNIPWFKKPQPAAFVMNYTGETLLRIFEKGLYIYQKKVKA